VRDIDIRLALKESLREFVDYDEQTVTVDELGILRGTARVDVAVVNGKLHGFEIKSLVDSLRRLPHQADAYSRVFDTVSLVTVESEVDEAATIVPDWWRILVASRTSSGSVEICVWRSGRPNPHVEARAVAELLWRDRALRMLKKRRADWGYRSKTCPQIWDRLCEVYTLDEVRSAVRSFLKDRLV